jgi:hypothetical protein
MRLVTKQGLELNPRYVRALRVRWNKADQCHAVAALDDAGEWLDLDSDADAGECEELFEPVIAGTGVLCVAIGDEDGEGEAIGEDIAIEQHAIIGWRLSPFAGREKPTPITATITETGWGLASALLAAVLRPDGELDGGDASYPNLAAFREAAVEALQSRRERRRRPPPPKPQTIGGC